MDKLTFDEWIHLAPHQREKIQREWKRNWDEWFYLLDEAVKSFKEKYGDLQEISRIDPAFGCIPDSQAPFVNKLITDPWINVITSLKENEFIEALPSEYAHFKVVQEPFNDIGQAYLNEWIVVLKNMLKWPEGKTIAWAQENHANDLKGKNSLLTHESPSYYLTSLFIPEDKKMLLLRLGIDKFLGKIQMAISYQNENPLDPIYDWIAARQRVNDVLKEIGASLPE